MFRVSGSDRNSRVATFGFCGLAIFGFVVLIWALGSLEGKQTEQRHTQTHRHAVAAEAKARERCTGTQAGAVFECVYDFVEASEETARAEQDLTAQQQAAWASIAAALIAFVSLPIGAIGLWALLRTISQGDDALAAAQEANGITLQAISADNRPWICPNSVDVAEVKRSLINEVYAEDSVGFYINWVNTGKTPATNVQMWRDYRILDYNDLSVPKFTDLEGKRRTRIMAPEQPVAASLILLSDQQLSDIRNRKSRVIIWSVVTYNNPLVPGEEFRYTSEVCYEVRHMGGKRDTGSGKKEAIDFVPTGPQNFLT